MSQLEPDPIFRRIIKYLTPVTVYLVYVEYNTYRYNTRIWEKKWQRFFRTRELAEEYVINLTIDRFIEDLEGYLAQYDSKWTGWYLDWYSNTKHKNFYNKIIEKYKLEFSRKLLKSEEDSTVRYNLISLLTFEQKKQLYLDIESSGVRIVGLRYAVEECQIADH